MSGNNAVRNGSGDRRPGRRSRSAAGASPTVRCARSRWPGAIRWATQPEKRIPAAQFLESGPPEPDSRSARRRWGWNTDGTVIDSLRLTNWDGGYPDVYAVPDFDLHPAAVASRRGPRHLRRHHAPPNSVAARPRAVLRRVLDRLAGLGYTAKIGVEFEFYLPRPTGHRSSGDPGLFAGETPTRSSR